jgi:hypothetical protein
MNEETAHAFLEGPFGALALTPVAPAMLMSHDPKVGIASTLIAGQSGSDRQSLLSAAGAG